MDRINYARGLLSILIGTFIVFLLMGDILSAIYSLLFLYVLITAIYNIFGEDNDN